MKTKTTDLVNPHTPYVDRPAMRASRISHADQNNIITVFQQPPSGHCISQPSKDTCTCRLKLGQCPDNYMCPGGN